MCASDSLCLGPCWAAPSTCTAVLPRCQQGRPCKCLGPRQAAASLSTCITLLSRCENGEDVSHSLCSKLGGGLGSRLCRCGGDAEAQAGQTVLASCLLCLQLWAAPGSCLYLYSNAVEVQERQDFRATRAACLQLWAGLGSQPHSFSTVTQVREGHVQTPCLCTCPRAPGRLCCTSGCGCPAQTRPTSKIRASSTAAHSFGLGRPRQGMSLHFGAVKACVIFWCPLDTRGGGGSRVLATVSSQYYAYTGSTEERREWLSCSAV